MYAHIEKRMKETGKPSPITLYEMGLGRRIGSIGAAKKLQEKK